MARDLSLGPSVVPCPVETSTAHDDSFFRATGLPPRKALSCCISAFAADFVYSLLSLNHLSSEIHIPQQISPSSQFSRRTSSPPWSAITRLGFSLVGLVPSFGPISLMKRKPNSIKSRSAPIGI
ncbi:unnamed protein product [Arabidopsis lyrata]|uniref:Predicted protein n=1 Tax=Arabidopsis lyrata subsp. lyrata TaxID=81972 RepID=D7M660_ARALL|nr:predicted protein [Arabidopsis lyrata subsp. lyrata]CAH8272446.1 unnamed protein product [Arabidopsis lyrata]